MRALLFILANSLFWVAVHFLSGYIVHWIPEAFYTIKNPLFRSWFWENRGRLYRQLFRIHHWKDLLPEAGTLLNMHPFSKRNLASVNRPYIERFILETCRAELSHVLPFLFFPLCLLWNPWPANLIMFTYAVLANLPCILVQRYNRIRLVNILHHFET